MKAKTKCLKLKLTRSYCFRTMITSPDLRVTATAISAAGKKKNIFWACGNCVEILKEKIGQVNRDEKIGIENSCF